MEEIDKKIKKEKELNDIYAQRLQLMKEINQLKQKIDPFSNQYSSNSREAPLQENNIETKTTYIQNNYTLKNKNENEKESSKSINSSCCLNCKDCCASCCFSCKDCFVSCFSSWKDCCNSCCNCENKCCCNYSPSFNH